MDRDASVMRQRLVEQGDHAYGTLQLLAQYASASPNDGWTIIQPVETPETPDIVKFELVPVVFNVPERADDGKPLLFVVASGWLELNRPEYRNTGALVTHEFATRAAYFRWKHDRLYHVYGAHYDVAFDELGHPTFHSQMRSFHDYAAHIRTQYNIEDEIEDKIDGVLRNVRLPTAQMDFFSFLLQMFADHLLIKGSTPEEKAAFNSLLARSEVLKGAASRSARLTADIARLCFRAMHWYPVVG